MSYVDNNLLHDEDVVHRASIHWFIFVPAIVVFALGIWLFGIDPETGTGPVLGMIAMILAAVSFVKAIITKISTELAVTSKRVIAKVGLVRRSTIELNHSKVESLSVDQSILGRIFGFGTLVVNGTGGGRTPIPSIDAPLMFRREAMQAIDVSQQS